MDGRVGLQRLKDLIQLFARVQGQIHEYPFSAAEFAGPARCATQPFVADSVPEILGE